MRQFNHRQHNELLRDIRDGEAGKRQGWLYIAVSAPVMILLACVSVWIF